MQTLSPILKHVDKVTDQDLPKSIVKMIGQYAGTDHCYTKGDTYYTCEPCEVTQIGQDGVPFFTREWPTHMYNTYVVNKCTPCTIDVSYMHTVYIVFINNTKFKIYHNKHLPSRKLAVCKRNDFGYQHLVKAIIQNTTELTYENMWERNNTHIIFLLNEQQYQKAGLSLSWVHNFIYAGMALDIIDGTIFDPVFIP